MASLPPGGLKSTTAEGQFFELAEYLVGLQRDSTTNPSNRSIFMTYSRNSLNDVVNMTVVLPVDAVISLNGSIVLTAKSVYSDPV